MFRFHASREIQIRLYNLFVLNRGLAEICLSKSIFDSRSQASCPLDCNKYCINLILKKSLVRFSFASCRHGHVLTRIFASAELRVISLLSQLGVLGYCYRSLNTVVLLSVHCLPPSLFYCSLAISDQRHCSRHDTVVLLSVRRVCLLAATGEVHTLFKNSLS